MSSFLLTIVFLLVMLIVLLAVPLSMRFSYNSEQQRQGFIHFEWLFGLVKFDANFPEEEASAIEKKQLQTSKEKSVKSKFVKNKAVNTPHNARGIIVLFKQSIFRRHIVHFIKRLLRACHAQDLYLRLRIGLGDPADTGMLWAALGPLSGLLKNLKGATIELEPEFIDPILGVEGHGQFRLIPLQFIALAVAFMLSPTTMRALNTVRQVN